MSISWLNLVPREKYCIEDGKCGLCNNGEYMSHTHFRVYGNPPTTLLSNTQFAFCISIQSVASLSLPTVGGGAATEVTDFSHCTNPVNAHVQQEGTSLIMLNPSPETSLNSNSLEFKGALPVTKTPPDVVTHLGHQQLYSCSPPPPTNEDTHRIPYYNPTGQGYMTLCGPFAFACAWGVSCSTHKAFLFVEQRSSQHTSSGVSFGPSFCR